MAERPSGESPLPRILFIVAAAILGIVLAGLFGVMYWLMVLQT